MCSSDLDLKSKTIVGGEALVRWNQSGKLIYPDEFIELFEKNRFITKLDYYVFEEVCKEIRGWMDNKLPLIKVAVNFSRRHLYNPQWVDQLEQIAKKWGIARTLLEIELTETVAFENEEILSSVMEQLHEYGFMVAMDDFGSGYSSLGMLKKLYFNSIKLDKSFVVGYNDKVRTALIVESIIRLAQLLGSEVIVEGIELQAQVDALLELGGISVQGYYFARPMPMKTFTQCLGELSVNQ